MAAIIWFGSKVLPFSIAILAAIAARLLVTGALHEDGLADFFDGFGGGGKDRSHNSRHHERLAYRHVRRSFAYRLLRAVLRMYAFARPIIRSTRCIYGRSVL